MDCCGLGENGENVNGELVFKEDFPGGRCSVGGWVGGEHVNTTELYTLKRVRNKDFSFKKYNRFFFLTRMFRSKFPEC